MKVNWKTHPNNIGHFYFQGCFRCHDGNHVSKDGKVISKDCNSCHTVIEQVEGSDTVAQIPSQTVQASRGYGRLESGELLRLPHRRRRAVRRLSVARCQLAVVGWGSGWPIAIGNWHLALGSSQSGKL